MRWRCSQAALEPLLRVAGHGHQRRIPRPQATDRRGWPRGERPRPPSPAPHARPLAVGIDDAGIALWLTAQYRPRQLHALSQSKLHSQRMKRRSALGKRCRSLAHLRTHIPRQPDG
jgi:hypothetical protein